MGFNIKGGDKSSLALLSSKRGRAYAKSRADEAFALPVFLDTTHQSPAAPPQANGSSRSQPSEHDAENVKQTMLQHESLFKEQLYELHRLYQKQCLLMAESNSVPLLDQEPEPPSSNCSFLCNSETLQPQEDKSDGFPKRREQIYQAFHCQMDDVESHENCVLSKEKSSRQVIDDRELNRKQVRCHVLDLERSGENRPVIDLERPADEQLHVEVKEERPQISCLSIKLENAVDPGHSSCFGNNGAGGKTELPVGVSRGFPCNKLFGFHINRSMELESPAAAKEEMQEGFSQQRLSTMNHTNSRVSLDKKLFGFDIIADHNNQREEMSKECFVAKETAPNRLLPLSERSIRMLTHTKKESLLYPKGPFSASGSCQGLPDLNGDAIFTEGHVPPLQALLQDNVNDSQYVNLDVNCRPGGSMSKLPHWLCQAPSARPLHMHGFVQRSVSQPKASAPFPQVSDNTLKPSFFLPQLFDKTNELHKLPVTKASAMHIQDPSYSGSQSSIPIFDQREAFLKEAPSILSSQSFYGSNAGTLERPYSGMHIREPVNEGVPYYSSHVRDDDKMDTPPLTSDNFSPNSMGSQGYQSAPQGLPMEFASKANSEKHMNFSTVFHWNQQAESFSSLLHQASNPEPFWKKLSPATPVSPWGIACSSQCLPSPGIDYGERAGLHTEVRNPESSIQPKIITEWPTFDKMHAGAGVAETVESMKDREHGLCTLGKTLFLPGQEPEVSSGDHPIGLNARKMLFDLNLSSEDFVAKGCFDGCNSTDISSGRNQLLSPNAESGMSRSSGWGTVDVIEVPSIYKPQKESGMKGDAAPKGELVVTLSDTIMMHLHNETSYLKRSADKLYLEGEMLRDGMFADYRFGEDETGGDVVEAKSSDASGLTSCESQGGVHLEHAKARDDSNCSGCEACHSLESRIPKYDEDLAFSSSLQHRVSPSHVGGIFKSSSPQDMHAACPQVSTERNCLLLNSKEFADENDAANVFSKKDLAEASEVADILVGLGLDMPPTVGDEDSTDDCRKCLRWLADFIPLENFNQENDVEFMDAIEQSLDINTNKTIDGFELAILNLKPVDPNIECIATQPPHRDHEVEVVPTLRRRPSRRGRAGKDLQKEMLRSMSALSRHEVTEDLQIIEGLIKSAAETANSCSLSPEKSLSSPEQASFGSYVKVKSPHTCKVRKLNGMLNVCAWGGESMQ